MTARGMEVILRDIRDALQGVDPRGCLGTAKAARYLDVPESTLREWVRMREIPVARHGKRLIFRVRDLDRWVEQRTRGERHEIG